MSVEGRISVDVVFHDTDGTNAINVLTLQDSQEYTTGKVAVITGTAGTAQVTFNEFGITPYRDASGSEVELSAITRIAFRWSGMSERTIADTLTNPTAITLSSKSSRIAITEYEGSSVSPVMNAGVGTGTYTILLFGS
jgi:hypothetical protein